MKKKTRYNGFGGELFAPTLRNLLMIND
jgi:hypothetical protein